MAAAVVLVAADACGETQEARSSVPTSATRLSGHAVGLAAQAPPSRATTRPSRSVSELKTEMLRHGGAASSAPTPSSDLRPQRTIWDDLADCESGWWDANRRPIKGSADWTYNGRDHGIFQGGLNFHPDTWDWVAPMVLDAPPADAHFATREQQIAVGIKVLEIQGWGAWPVCSRKIGAR